MKLTFPLVMRPGLLLLLGATLFFTNCKDDEKDLTPQQEVVLTKDITIVDNSIDEELEAIDESILEAAGGREKADCAIVTKDINAKTIVLDFGTGCVGRYGRTREGKVIITYTGTFDNDQANRTITFDNYFVDGNQIEGTVNVKNFTRNNSGFLTAEREAVDYKITLTNGTSYTINGTTIRAWIEGEGDGIKGNEVIEVTGGYTGVTSNGISFTREITTPIRADFSCWSTGGFLRTAGVIEMEITNSVRTRTRTINYGNGTCDNTVVITINEVDYTITVGA